MACEHKRLRCTNGEFFCLDCGAKVEIPVYQRQNTVIFSAERVDMATVTPDITAFWGWENDIEKLEMK